LIDLSWLLGCFIGFWGQKWVEKLVFGPKILNLDFSTITMVENWKKSNNTSSDFVFKEN
jgi:hypothetical protein